MRCASEQDRRSGGILFAVRSVASNVGLWSAVFVLAVVAIPARATYGAQVTADEPQYLLTALSLAEDVDLDISDELGAERFRDFHEVRLNPQTIALNDSGQRLSPHDPLLPVLLAPAMAVGQRLGSGWVGAKVALAALGALTAVITRWLAVHRVGVAPAVATLVVVGLFAAPPLTSYSTQVYPEMPAALAVVTALALLLPPPSSGRSWGHDLGLVAVVVALPWLAVKYVPVAAVFGSWAVIGHLRSSRPGRWLRAATIAGLLVVAGVIYLVVHHRIYGGWTVYAAGDHFVDGEFRVVGDRPNYAGRSRRLIGLLVDRTFGLIPWTPTYLLAAPALASLVRRRPPGWSAMVAAVAAGWAVATWVALTMHGWWWPGRQLVVILPLVVIAIAALVDQHRRVLVPAFGVASLLSAGTWSWLVVEASTGRRTLIVDFMDTANPWYRAWSALFPDHLGVPPLDGPTVAWTAAWSAALAVGAYLAWRATPTGRSASAEGEASTR